MWEHLVSYPVWLSPPFVSHAYLSRLMFLVYQSKILGQFCELSSFTRAWPRSVQIFKIHAKCNCFHQLGPVLPGRHKHHVHESNSFIFVHKYTCMYTRRPYTTNNIPLHHAPNIHRHTPLPLHLRIHGDSPKHREAPRKQGQNSFIESAISIMHSKHPHPHPLRNGLQLPSS